MRFWRAVLFVLFLCHVSSDGQAMAEPTMSASLVVVPETKQVRVSGVIYPARFNAAQGEEAHYHFLVWQGGTSTHALIETPADDLAFHDALVKLGGQPGDNLPMAAWTERHDAHSTASQEKVVGSPLEVRLLWASNPTGISIDRAFRSPNPQTPDSRLQTPDPRLYWHFGGNRARWFNRIPLASRPGCLACLYSCPSGKVSNGAFSIHHYVASPDRFVADTDALPPDGTPVVVTFQLSP